jgi:hypothetical protein
MVRIGRWSFVICSTLLVIPCCVAQRPAIVWQATLGGTGTDMANAIIPVSDGGLILTGSTGSNDGDVSGLHGGVDVWVAKLDPQGAILWQHCYGGSQDDEGADIAELPDGGFVVAGSTSSNDGDVSGGHGQSDAWVIRLDAAGALVWQRSLGGSYSDLAQAVVALPDMGCFVGGTTNSVDGDVTGVHGGSDLWGVRLDPSGNTLWSRAMGGTANEQLYDARSLPGGGFVVGGETSSSNGDVTGSFGLKDLWLVKLDDSGAIVWSRCQGGSQYDGAHSVDLTSQGFRVCGFSSSSDGIVPQNIGLNDVWAMELDPLGAILDQHVLGGSMGETGVGSIATWNGETIIAARTISNNGHVAGNHGATDAWIVRLDEQGELLWQGCYGGSLADYPNAICGFGANGLVLAGLTNSSDGDVVGSHGSGDVWVFAIAQFDVGMDDHGPMPLRVHPNPTNGILHVDLAPTTGGHTMQLMDTFGRILMNRSDLGVTTRLELGSFPSGLYMLSVTSDQGRSAVRVILEHGADH